LSCWLLNASYFVDNISLPNPRMGDGQDKRQSKASF
jgi:hypothetical protein